MQLSVFSNYLGNKAWTLNLDWKSKDEFQAAEEHEWEGVGMARTADGFTFLQVRCCEKDAGFVACWSSVVSLFSPMPFAGL